MELVQNRISGFAIERRNLLRATGAGLFGTVVTSQAGVAKSMSSGNSVDASRASAAESPDPLPGYSDPPQDLDGDGLYEDVDGDGEFTIFDVQAFFTNFQSETVQSNPAAFNFNGDDNPEEGGVTIFDVQALFTKLASPSPPPVVIRYDPQGNPIQEGELIDTPDGQPKAGETVSITIELEARKPDATDNILYGILGTTDGDIYGLNRMPGLGSGTVTVSPTLPSNSTGEELVWTWVFGVSESVAADNYKNAASGGNLYPDGDDTELSLGTIE